MKNRGWRLRLKVKAAAGKGLQSPPLRRSEMTSEVKSATNARDDVENNNRWNVVTISGLSKLESPLNAKWERSESALFFGDGASFLCHVNLGASTRCHGNLRARAR